MALKCHWKCDEGSGLTLLDSVGGITLTPIAGHEIKWCYGKVMGTDRWYISPYTRGLGLGTVTPFSSIRSAVTITTANPSIAFFFRQVNNYSGCCIRFETLGYFWYTAGNFQLSANVCLNSGEWQKGVWHHFALVENIPNCDVYLDGVYIRSFAYNWSCSGNVRFNSFNDTNNAGCMELADVRLYDAPITAGTIASLATSLGSRPTKWSLFNDGSDFGAIPSYDEYGATVSNMEISGGVSKFNFDGATCIGARATLLKPSMTKLWAYWEVKIPGVFDGNHSFGDEFTIFEISKSTSYRYTTDNTVWINMYHDLATNDITEMDSRLTNTGGTTTTPMLNAQTLAKDTWIPLELYCDFATGVCKCWVDNILQVNISGYTFDYANNTILLGLFQGTHPELAGNFYYGRNYYVGEEQYGSSTATNIYCSTDGFTNQIKWKKTL